MPALVVDDVPEAWGSGRAAYGPAWAHGLASDNVLEITEVEAGADAEWRGASVKRRLQDTERAERGELTPSGLVRAWEMEKDDIDWPTLDDWYKDGLNYPKRRRL